MEGSAALTRLRTAYALGGLALLLLLIGSAFCWRERILFTDPSFILFELLQAGHPIISEHRYGAVITQVFPLLGFHLGLPLAAVCWLYSVSFYLFFAAVYALVGLRWRQYGLGLLLVLYLSLFVSDVYFWPNNEIHQAVGWAVLFLGLYLHLRPRPLGLAGHLLLIVLLVVATNTHPLVAAPLSFLWVVLLWQRAGELQRLRLRDALYTVVLLMGIGFRYFLSRESWYDGHKLQGVKQLDWASVAGSFESAQLRTLLEYSELYWPVVGLLGLGVLAALRARSWVVVVLTLLAGVAYVVLVCVTYPVGFGREQLYYFESEWMGLGLLLATPFVLYFVPRYRVGASVGVLLLVFGVRAVALVDSYTYFHRRVENLETLTAALRERGLPKVIDYPAFDWAPYFGVSWGLPLETLWASTLTGAATVTVKVVNNEGEAMTRVGEFRSNFKRMPVKSMAPGYYRVDPSGDYHTLTATESAALRELLRPLSD